MLRGGKMSVWLGQCEETGKKELGIGGEGRQGKGMEEEGQTRQNF